MSTLPSVSMSLCHATRYMAKSLILSGGLMNRVILTLVSFLFSFQVFASRDNIYGLVECNSFYDDIDLETIVRVEIGSSNQEDYSIYQGENNSVLASLNYQFIGGGFLIPPTATLSIGQTTVSTTVNIDAFYDPNETRDIIPTNGIDLGTLELRCVLIRK